MTIAPNVLHFAYISRFVLGFAALNLVIFRKNCKPVFYVSLNRFRGSGGYRLSTLLKTSPAFKRVFKCWPTFTSFAARKTFPVAASIVME